MEQLILGIDPGVRASAIAFAGVAVVVLGYLHEQAFQPAKARSSSGIVAFEFAGTPQRSAAILSQWGRQGRVAAKRAVWTDLSFVVAYSALLSLACGSLADVAGARTWSWMVGVGWWLAGLVLVAGLLDWFENWALLRTLTTFEPGARDCGIKQLYPAVAFVAAAVKFAILIPAVLYLVFGVAILYAGTPAAGP